MRLKKRDFLLIYHERLYIPRKPMYSGEYEKHKYSSCIEL